MSGNERKKSEQPPAYHVTQRQQDVRHADGAGGGQSQISVYCIQQRSGHRYRSSQNEIGTLKNAFSFIFVFMGILPACMYVHHRDQKRALDPKTAVTDDCKLPRGCRESNPDPLEEQPVLILK